MELIFKCFDIINTHIHTHTFHCIQAQQETVKLTVKLSIVQP